MAVCLIAAGAGGYLLFGRGHASNAEAFRVVMKTNASWSDERRVEARIHAVTGTSTGFISKAEALAYFERRYPKLTHGLAFNPLPDVITVNASRKVDVAALERSLRSLPGVSALSREPGLPARP
jgi:cell division protein FtsX